MFNLYHNLSTADELRSDGAIVVGAVSEALRMWAEERKEIIFEVVLEKDHYIYYENNDSIDENITVVEADGRVTPRTVRDAATVVKRFLERTKDTLGLSENVTRVDVVRRNEAHLKLEDQLQAILDCLYAEGEKK